MFKTMLNDQIMRDISRRHVHIEEKLVIMSQGPEEAYTPHTNYRGPSIVITRPDTRPSVADGWAGVEMRVFSLFDLWLWTNQRTDGWTKPLIELRVRN